MVISPFVLNKLKRLAARHFGLGHGSGAHAPHDYYIIESANPKIQGFDGATMSFVEYLYELAKQNSGERAGLACWFESLAAASRPLQRRRAETIFPLIATVVREMRI